MYLDEVLERDHFLPTVHLIKPCNKFFLCLADRVIFQKIGNITKELQFLLNFNKKKSCLLKSSDEKFGEKSINFLGIVISYSTSIAVALVYYFTLPKRKFFKVLR